MVKQWLMLLIFAAAVLGGSSTRDQEGSAPGTKHPVRTEKLSMESAGNPGASPSSRQPSVRSDIRRAKAAVWRMNGYTPDAVMVNGKDMWVHVYTEKRLNHRERMKEESGIRRQLMPILPGYRIYVKIEVQ